MTMEITELGRAESLIQGSFCDGTENCSATIEQSTGSLLATYLADFDEE